MKICWVLLKSSKTPMGFAQTGDDFVFFCSDLVSFAQIQWFDFFCSDLMSLTQIWRQFDYFFLRSSKFCTNPTKIRRKIQIVAQKEPPKASSFDSAINQSNPIWPDLLVFAIGGEFSHWKPDVIGSVAGWAQTQPRPTRGHP